MCDLSPFIADDLHLFIAFGEITLIIILQIQNGAALQAEFQTEAVIDAQTVVQEFVCAGTKLA